MKFALIIITIGILLLALMIFSPFIHIFIMKIRNKKLEKQNAELALELLQKHYDLHLIARSLYYKAKFIEDPILKKEKMDKYKAMYDNSISAFSDPEILKHRKYFYEHCRTDFEEILERPLYKLI